MTNIYNFADLSEMALYPCAYSATFNVSREQAQRHTEPALPGHAGRQQLERGAVFRSHHDDGADIGLQPGEFIHVIADAPSTTAMDAIQK